MGLLQTLLAAAALGLTLQLEARELEAVGGSKDVVADEVAAALACTRNPQGAALLQKAAESARAGYAHDPQLATMAQLLWEAWMPEGVSQQRSTALGTLAAARALLSEAPAPQLYCLPAHAAAGFFVARWMPVAYAEAIGQDLNPNVLIPGEVLDQMENVLLKAYMLYGHNRLLDLGKLVGWPVGAAEIMEARDAIARACPQRRAEEEGKDAEDARPQAAQSPSSQCTLASIEAELRGGLPQCAGPLLPPADSVRAARQIPRSWGTQGYRPPQAGGCRARAAAGGLPCNVRVWYLGTHEALFREVEHMWLKLSDEFLFDFVRVNRQGIYSPADAVKSGPHVHLNSLATSAEEITARSSNARWEIDKLNFRLATEEVLDVQPAALRLRELISLDDPIRGTGTFDAILLLCTIPAYVCSAFAEMPLPIVMYAANPATAQVPFTMQAAWLPLLAQLAANPANQMLVTNPHAQAQFEYQLGISFPMIRVHGLYTGVRRPPATGRTLERQMQVLVYDRTGPLLAKALEGLRRYAAGGATDSARTAAQALHFVYHADTDRAYATFATFDAVVFAPGDVEQMAFYEFYSMELPIFVPADPGRFLKPWLPGNVRMKSRACGDYSSWTGAWELNYASGESEVFVIECSGRVAADMSGDHAMGQLHPLPQMDERGFTHCLEGAASRKKHVRVRLQREHMEVARLAGGGRLPCVGTFAAASAAAVAEVGRGNWVFANGMRRPGEEPPLPMLWDHEIFASSAWYLDARLPGPRRTRHSPFRLSSIAAAREWAAFMDYFRFPAVGLFVSAVELLVGLTADAGGNLVVRQRAMRHFNDRGLRESMQQWQTVLHMAVGSI